jgi:hypothetical protein
MFVKESLNIVIYYIALLLYIKQFVLNCDPRLQLLPVAQFRLKPTILKPSKINKTKRFMNRTRPTGYIKENIVGITTIADYAAELIFNLQIVILVEDIVSSEIPA